MTILKSQVTISEIKSPCVKICKLVKRRDSDEKFCLGCGRTKEEIKAWKKMTDIEKQTVLKRLTVS